MPTINWTEVPSLQGDNLEVTSYKVGCFNDKLISLVDITGYTNSKTPYSVSIHKQGTTIETLETIQDVWDTIEKFDVYQTEAEALKAIC